MKDVLGREYLADSKDEEKEAGGIPGLTKLPPEEQAREEMRMFRDVFSGDKGRIVLTQILTDLKYFSRCTTDEDMALSNYAKYLLQERMGVNDTYKLVNAMLEAK